VVAAVRRHSHDDQEGPQVAGFAEKGSLCRQYKTVTTVPRRHRQTLMGEEPGRGAVQLRQRYFEDQTGGTELERHQASTGGGDRGSGRVMLGDTTAT